MPKTLKQANNEIGKATSSKNVTNKILELKESIVDQRIAQLPQPTASSDRRFSFRPNALSLVIFL